MWLNACRILLNNYLNNPWTNNLLGFTFNWLSSNRVASSNAIAHVFWSATLASCWIVKWGNIVSSTRASTLNARQSSTSSSVDSTIKSSGSPTYRRYTKQYPTIRSATKNSVVGCGLKAGGSGGTDKSVGIILINSSLPCVAELQKDGWVLWAPYSCLTGTVVVEQARFLNFL